MATRDQQQTALATPIASDGVLDQHSEHKAALAAFLDSLDIGEDPDHNRGLLIESLHKAQDLYGYLPESVQLFVANALGLHLSEVYGVISFYSFFTDQPRGRHRINICTGTACFVRGAGRLMDEFERHLGIEEGGTTDNGEFSLDGLRCVGACSLAPVVMVDDRVYGNVTPNMVPQIIDECD